MSELEDKINALLSDPAQMESISRLAAQFMGQGNGEESAPAEPATPPFPGFDMDMLARVGKLLSGAGGGGSDKTALLKAMGPYLAPKRREKMEKAMKFARMAKIAGVAFKEYGGGGGV